MANKRKGDARLPDPLKDFRFLRGAEPDPALVERAKTELLGHIVYKPYAPAQHGKVVAFGWVPDRCWVVQVKWPDGTITEELLYPMGSLEHLAAEHRRKADKWDAILAKAKGI